MEAKISLVKGLPRERLFEALHFHLRRGDSHRFASAFYLLEVEERGEARALGFANAAHYAREALGLAEKKARELLRIARGLKELELIREAFDRGEIGWSKLREITRVATVETEAEWLEFAKRNSAGKVEGAVSRAKRGDRPKKSGLGTPRTKFRVQFLLSTAVYEVWNTALTKAVDECGRGSSVEDAVRRIAESALRTGSGESARDSKDGKPKPIYAVVFHTTRDGKKAWIESADGPAPVEPEFVDQLKRASGDRRYGDPRTTRPRSPRRVCRHSIRRARLRSQVGARRTSLARASAKNLPPRWLPLRLVRQPRLSRAPSSRVASERRGDKEPIGVGPRRTEAERKARRQGAPTSRS